MCASSTITRSQSSGHPRFCIVWTLAIWTGAWGAWRKWSADPWLFVNGAPEDRATAEVATAIANIKSQASLADLGAWWTGFQKAQKAIAGMPEVIAAKDRRKGELAMKETHQGAG